MGIMAVGTCHRHVDAACGWNFVTLRAQGVVCRHRFVLTRLLVAPGDLFQHDAVFHLMARVTLHRGCRLRVWAGFPDRCNFILAQRYLWRQRLCGLRGCASRKSKRLSVTLA